MKRTDPQRPTQPARCIVFVVAQSQSMERPFGGLVGTRKCDEVAAALNAWLYELLDMQHEIPTGLHLCILGYRTDANAGPIVENVRLGPTTEWLTAADSIALSGTATSWVRGQAEGATPTCHAFHDLYCMLETWVTSHPQTTPPTVFHVTDAPATDGPLLPYANTLRSLKTASGNVRLYHCLLSDRRQTPVIFPSREGYLNHPFERELFHCSSEMPHSGELGSRGVIVRADQQALVTFLRLATNVARSVE